MGEWVETPYGRRFKEDHGTTTTFFFMTAPNEDGKRQLSKDVFKIMLEAKLLENEEDRTKSDDNNHYTSPKIK